MADMSKRFTIGFLVLLFLFAGAAAAQQRPANVGQPRDPFTRFDKNEDGLMDLEEFKIYVDERAKMGERVCSNIVSNDAYEGTFNAFDKDGNKGLTRAEFIAFRNIEAPAPRA